MYQFYSDGFFGYAQEGNFQPYGISHLVPILLLIAAVTVTWKMRGVLRGWKQERRFRFILSFVMLLAEMSCFWRLLYVGDDWGNHTLMDRLPLQVCQWGLICCVYMITSENDSLFGINFLSPWSAPPHCSTEYGIFITRVCKNVKWPSKDESNLQIRLEQKEKNRFIFQNRLFL